MAYKSCSAAMAANIQMDCDKPLAGGFSGRAIGIPLSPAPTFAVSAENPLIIEAVTAAEGGKFFAIENFGEQPFSGTSSASSADGGVMKHTKTFQFTIPKRGAAASKDIVDPLTRLPLGFMVIAERRDGTYEVYGYEQGLRVNADGVTNDAYTNDGATQIVSSATQYNYEYEFFTKSKADTQKLFEQYLTTNTL